ncbi:MAG: metallophosphoesterase [Planctomycetota bacterium]
MGQPFRLAVTADVHHDVAKSRAAAEELARTWPTTDADALLIAGDAATSDERHLEEALSLFADDGRPRLFLPGNHEYWSRIDKTDVHQLLRRELPRRVRDCGWHWLPGDPWRDGDVAVVGTSGWYDYGFADEGLGLPIRFYRDKLSPAAAAYVSGNDLRPGADDVPEHARSFFARWNDARFIQGLTDDTLFCRERAESLRKDLQAVSEAERVAVGVHVCPTNDLLPRRPSGAIPPDRLKYAFARAYLGSPIFGDVATTFRNVRHVVCGHSHIAREATRGDVQLTNVGSGYTEKRMIVLEL